MPQLIVSVPQLYRRKYPVTDNADTSNIVGQVFSGHTFTSAGLQINNLGTWYYDSDGYYYWAGGLTIATSGTQPENSKTGNPDNRHNLMKGNKIKVCPAIRIAAKARISIAGLEVSPRRAF